MKKNLKFRAETNWKMKFHSEMNRKKGYLKIFAKVNESSMQCINEKWIEHAMWWQKKGQKQNK